MYVAKNIYSSYYWLDQTKGNNKLRLGVLIDVRIGEDVVEEVNKKFTFT